MSQRTEQVEATLKKIVAELLNKEIELPQDHLVTVTRVSVSPDLKNAKIFVSVLPFDSAEDIMPLLDKHRHTIQQEAVKQMTMKQSPVMKFVLDTKPEEASEIERLIDEEMNLFDI